MSQQVEPVDISTGRFLNESAIKNHALKCAKLFRPKFTRVGQDFIDEVKTDVECLVRNVRSREATALHDPAQVDEVFTTGALMDKIQDSVNGLIGRIIQNKVQRQTTGCTLKSTRG